MCSKILELSKIPLVTCLHTNTYLTCHILAACGVLAVQESHVPVGSQHLACRVPAIQVGLIRSLVATSITSNPQCSLAGRPSWPRNLGHHFNCIHWTMYMSRALWLPEDWKIVFRVVLWWPRILRYFPCAYMVSQKVVTVIGELCGEIN